jgi:hypothetical protein
MPAFGLPPTAPPFQDQRYVSPARRYSEAEIASALAQEFALMERASRSAARDQVFVESSRAANQRALQSDLLANQRYLADTQARIQGQALANQRYLADVQARIQSLAQPQQLGGQRSVSTMSATIPIRRSVASAAIARMAAPTSAPYDANALANALAREKLAAQERMQGSALAAQAARQAAELAARSFQQGAEIASRERMQAAQIQGQKDLQQQGRELEDELRRRAALRALQAFNQASPTGRQINLANQGRV